MSNPSTQLARVVVQALVAAGVRQVVLCPGSRSAPLAYALHAADAAGSLCLHVRHDERSAAFTALGMGSAGSLAAVVTTSGTAVANLHPAVAEAAEAAVPMLVVTADRPHRLRGTWANQTTALQASMFGAAARVALDLAAPAPGQTPAQATTTWRVGVHDAARAARGEDGGRPGPAHLNLAFDEPLVPDDQLVPGDPLVPGDAGYWVPSVVVPDPRRAAAAEAADLLARLGVGPERTVIVAGHAAGDLARALAEQAGWPLLAEPSSLARAGANAVGPYRLLLADPSDAGLGAAIQRVVVLGRPTLSRPVTRLLARDGVEVVQVVAHPGDPGPEHAVTRVVVRDVPRGAVGPSTGAVTSAWLAAWQRAGAVAARALDAVLNDEAAAGALSGPLLAREVAAACGPGAVLVAAASNAVRDLDLTAYPWPVGAAPLVLANRGLAGIDGTMSTASGAALATGRPTHVLVGDLAFLHDANGLLLPPGEREPDLRVVVLDDDGGGIFTGLEHGDPSRSGTFERLFGTPHGTDLAALCAGLRVPYELVDDLARLRAVLREPVRGRSVVHIRADRAGLRALHERLRAAVRSPG